MSNDNLSGVSRVDQIFGQLRYSPSDLEKEELKKNLSLLEANGLSQLIKKLEAGGRNIWDLFVEFRFVLNLIKQHEADIKIEYEPDYRPIDFHVIQKGIEFWIQVKNLSTLERRDRKSKIVESIAREVRDVKVGMFFNVALSEQFGDSDKEQFVQFIKRVACGDFVADKEYLFSDSSSTKAKVKFTFPSSKVLSHLTSGTKGQMSIEEITGEPETQVKGSLTKAAKAFDFNYTEKGINLVVINVDTYSDIDIFNAIYGTEFFVTVGNKAGLRRGRNGFITNPEFCERVSAIIALRCDEGGLFSPYSKTIFVNEACQHLVPTISNLIRNSTTVTQNNFPVGS